MVDETNDGHRKSGKENKTQQSAISCLESTFRAYEESGDSFERMRFINSIRHAHRVYPELSKQYLNHLIKTDIYLLSMGDIFIDRLVESVSLTVEFNLLDSLKEYMEKIYGHIQNKGKEFEFRMALFGIINKAQGAGYNDIANELRTKYLKTQEAILTEHARNHSGQQGAGGPQEGS